MNYERDWNNRRNAVGFAAACARLALSFYDGEGRSDLVAAIEIAERCANGEQIDDAEDFADAICDDDYDAADVAWSAVSAVSVIPAAYSAYYAIYAAADAGHVGVDSSEIQIAYARWVVRDLSSDQDLDEELRAAVGAAIVAGDEDLARQLVKGTT